MASIIGEKPKFRNAEGGFFDKFFGYADQSVNIYNKAKSGAIDGTVTMETTPSKGMLGLPTPWGGVILVLGAGLLAFGLYKIAK